MNSKVYMKLSKYVYICTVCTEWNMHMFLYVCIYTGCCADRLSQAGCHPDPHTALCIGVIYVLHVCICINVLFVKELFEVSFCY